MHNCEKQQLSVVLEQSDIDVNLFICHSEVSKGFQVIFQI